MLSLQVGSYVTHSKLPELGSGEILSFEQGRVGIRFASGDRSFLYHLVVAHLVTSLEAPVLPSRAVKRKKAAPRPALTTTSD